MNDEAEFLLDNGVIPLNLCYRRLYEKIHEEAIVKPATWEELIHFIHRNPRLAPHICVTTSPIKPVVLYDGGLAITELASIQEPVSSLCIQNFERSKDVGISRALLYTEKCFIPVVLDHVVSMPEFEALSYEQRHSTIVSCRKS